MAGYKFLKRKGGVDQISDDFSDFSLSSPATKIRRLDGALPPIVEEDEPNEERALVLFKPIHHSPPPLSLTLNSDLISEIKHQQLPWSKQRDSCDYNRIIGGSHEIEEEQDDSNNGRLAIVPWVPQQPSPSSQSSTFDDNNNSELMEADEIGGGEEEEEGEGMDVEQEDTAIASNSSASTFQNPTMLNLHQGVPEGFQQHCLLPHLPQNTSTPITWTR